MPPLFMCCHVFPSCLFSPTFILCCFFTCCLRCDITAILLFVENLMYSVCENPEALVRSRDEGSDWPYQIHSLCEELLAVLIIVTAPLSLLYRFVLTDTINFSGHISIQKATIMQIPCVKTQKNVQVVLLPHPVLSLK